MSIPTLEAAGREAIADRLVEAMQAATTMTFTNRSTPGDLKEGECRLMQTPEGKWSGWLQFQANIAEAIRSIFRKLHGAAVEVDGSSHTVEVISDFISN